MESSCVVSYLEEVHLDRRQPRLCHQGIYFLGSGLMTWAMQLWNVEDMESSVVSGRQGTKDPWRHGKVCSQPTPQRHRPGRERMGDGQAVGSILLATRPREQGRK